MSVKPSKESIAKSSESHNVEPLHFPQITSMEDVITNFFNQIVQYVIDDMIIVAPKEEKDDDAEPPNQVIKDYKDLNQEDLINAEITSASGSKVTLTRKTSSLRKNRRSSQISNLDVIKEEAEKSASKTSTSASSSLQDLLMEEERQVKIFFSNGNFYEGRISNRIMNGEGRYVWADGTVYEGDFKDGFPTGRGTMTLPDLSHYEGDFSQGFFHGYGFLNVVSTPSFYSGEWKNGLKHGHGWLLYEPGDWYEGGWAYDLKDGFGLRYYKNGAKYRGNWSKGKYDGEGTMIWENNDYYKGEWSEGLMHGQGEYIWKAFYNNTFAFPIQTIYRGAWEYGKRCGKGTMLFGDDSGLKLKGQWEKDFKHGDGYLVCGNGRIIEERSLFQYDKLLQRECSVWSFRRSTLFDRILDLPIFTAPENVDVGFYVDKILSKLQGVHTDKLRLLKSYEEKCIRNIITRYLPQLKELYYEYASIAAKTKLNFEPILIRLFLWQFYKDKEISKCGISLAETDDILAENPKSCLDTIHGPFEPIYFWQFVMSLVGVALDRASLEEEMYDGPSRGGISAFILKKFFDEVVFAKEQDHQSSLILNYLDMAPIKAVYLLYQKIGEPHTARTFLKESCTRKGEAPLLCYLKFLSKKGESKFGTNVVPLDQHVTFERRSGSYLNDFSKHDWTNLFDFRHLGPRNIVRCLAKTCPLIMNDDLVVNMDYPLTFLEFFEILITCIFMILDLEVKKEETILKSTLETPANVLSPSVGSFEPKKKRTKDKKKGGKKVKKKNA